MHTVTPFRFSITVIVFILLSAASYAQTELQINRIYQNWPLVFVDFTVKCNGVVQAPVNKDLYTLTENGKPVYDWDLYAPQLVPQCRMSVALLFDGSGRAGATWHSGRDAGVSAFIDKMLPGMAEASVIWYTFSANIELGMTSNKIDLADAASSIPSFGARAMWNGLYVSLQEIALSGSNPCKAVIAFVEGPDNASTRTIQEVVDLAQSESIRIYTIGAPDAPHAVLDSVTSLTGGKHYQLDNPGQIPATYKDIYDIIANGFDEMLIRYKSRCPDATERNVKIEITGYCGSSASDTTSFTAPSGSASGGTMGFGLRSASGESGTLVSVPLLLETGAGKNVTMERMYFRIGYDGSALEFVSFANNADTLLYNANVGYRVYPNYVEIFIYSSVPVPQADTLGLLIFRPLANPVDSVKSRVSLDVCAFLEGCQVANALSDADVTILHTDELFLYPATMKLCPGDTAAIVAPEGFTEYNWTNGGRTRGIEITEPGTYQVAARNAQGQWSTSNPVVVTLHHVPWVRLEPGGTQILCHGNSLDIGVAGLWQSYRWSTGSTLSRINVATEGKYWLDIVDDNGCTVRSDTVEVKFFDVSFPINGRTSSCRKSNVKYSVTHDPALRYTWYVNGGTIVEGERTHEITVDWEQNDGYVISNVYNDVNGCTSADTIMVHIVTHAPDITVTGPEVLCPGDEAVLTVSNTFGDYLWNTGARTNVLRTTASGVYYCRVRLDGCEFYTDTVTVARFDEIPIVLTGVTGICAGEKAVYNSTVHNGLHYTWEVDGGTIASGSGTPQVEVDWNTAQSGFVRVTVGNDSCEISDTLLVEVYPRPEPHIQSEETTICEGDTVNVTVTDIFDSYEWSSGDTTAVIRVTTTGDYSVTVMNAHGCEAVSQTIHIEVLPSLPVPLITRNGNLLTCSVSADSYQWFIDGNPIAGETAQTMLMQGDGTYTVQVANALGCAVLSQPFVITGLGPAAPSIARTFSISPNPTSGAFNVALEFEQPTAFSMRMVNVLGQTVYSRTVNEKRIEYRGIIRLNDKAPGVYFFMLESGGAYDCRKVVVRYH